MFRSKYDHYYIKNANCIIIQNWKLLCVTYNGIKLARFYDKNMKSALKDRLYIYYKKNNKNIKLEKKLIKDILNHFGTKYGIYLIYFAMFELIQEKKIEFSQKIIKRIQRKISV